MKGSQTPMDNDGRGYLWAPACPLATRHRGASSLLGWANYWRWGSSPPLLVRGQDNIRGAHFKAKLLGATRIQ